MSPELKVKLGQLPPNELAEVGQWVLLRLRDVNELELFFKRPEKDEEEIERLWAKEAVTRLEEYRTGKAEPISAEESEKQVLEALANVRMQRSA